MTRTTEYAQMIEFDVAITASDTSSVEGGAGISIAPLRLGGSGTSESQQQSVSRVKFFVPLTLPGC